MNQRLPSSQSCDRIETPKLPTLPDLDHNELVPVVVKVKRFTTDAEPESHYKEGAQTTLSSTSCCWYKAEGTQVPLVATIYHGLI
jgi:hypothetical protein